ncbi:MAG TPA: heme-degrading domain-containing protein [Aestuariivirga sp.]
MSLESDIERLKLQEEKLQFSKLDEADAWVLGSAMLEKAVEKKLPLVIDIRVAGRPLFYAALPGTSPDNAEWVRRKINVVMRLHKCSYRVSRENAQSGQALDELRGVNPIDVAPHGGCFPIHIIGTGIVGTVTVSGIPQREDHNFVAECLSQFLGVDYAQIALQPESA